MTDITDTIRRVRELDAAATKGPWELPLAWPPEDSALIAYYRTAAPELAREVERLREERDKIVETAVACIGKACERHTLQAQSEPFAAFNARHETLACHWCEHEEVERLRERVAELEGLLTRVVKYTVEDRAVTPGCSRLGRVVGEARAALSKGGE